jgi:pimeloyl-ACP methyl ester carboxylesterase
MTATEEQHQHDPDPRLDTVMRYRSIEQLIPPHWVEGCVTANGIAQHYWRTGDGTSGARPTVILLHGHMLNGLSWLRVAKALEAGFDLILPDARGHGQSDGLAAGNLSAPLVADLAGLIHALGLEQPHLLGHSMGASTAAHAAAAYPEMIGSILLEDPPWQRRSSALPTDSPGYNAWLASYLAWVERYRTLTRTEQYAAALEQMSPGANFWAEEDEYVPWVHSLAQFDLDWLRRAADLWREDGSVSGVLPRVACPVLYMPAAGQSSFGIFSRPEAPTLPNVTTIPFDTGHFIHLAAFDRYIGVVTAFLEGNDPAAH